MHCSRVGIPDQLCIAAGDVLVASQLQLKSMVELGLVRPQDGYLVIGLSMLARLSC
jgi:hypothetical protein